MKGSSKDHRSAMTPPVVSTVFAVGCEVELLLVFVVQKVPDLINVLIRLLRALEGDDE